MQTVSTQKGFTLIELIIVIVLLGILAVTAAPKFLNLQDDARDSVLQGMAGSLESASSVIYGKSLINDVAGTSDGSESVNVGNSTTVSVVYGYPDAATTANFTSILDSDIGNTGGDYQTAVVTGTPTKILIYYAGFGDYATTAPSAAGAACAVEYTNATAEGERPVITVNTCVL
ncbi:prepilin-type N-terminal cleavage/methylation domain-containing protein [Alteromonas sp. 1_MG-2023]|uniref:prepilin-type N-terminal cleavage/methylation domain-containing protein n=1 Tax=Alteromonas sp. 1_MG-2023 TaxID=3062669 RepID=UPI0026E4867A|nr:prepilin-type N-terminal cleavage/methylation domain-containing protein [Alteromonas sp. 1_MG-2023]MDO6566695.1 prepilin-type N-terminal cleavage/methylation domain-containing protein [Alteromonas sp. 1_MG-2023]